MSRNVFKPKGKLRKYEPGAGVATVKNVPIIATVMDNIDPTNSGKLFVFPSESMDKASQDRDTWIPVRRLHTFFGSVRPTASATQTTDDSGNVTASEYGQYVGNPSSYGQWNAPPDIGTKVICIFVNGDLNYGFYIGAVPDPDELQMVPAIGSSDNIIANEGEAASYGGATTLPVTNINTNNKGVADSPDYLSAAKPIHSYAAFIMQQQGILRDRIRGPIGSSASREATSRVGWGVSTPGRPIYEGGYTDGGNNSLASKINEKQKAASGDNTEYNDFNTSMRVVARRGGHSLVMDDGDIIGRDQLIRLRTALGHQILMSDDGQVLMILHSNGQSYIELGKEGTVDIFGTNSINLRTQGDLNLHADNNLNIHAGKDININAQENIHVNSLKKYTQRVGEAYELHGLQNLLFKSDQNIGMESAGKWSGKSGGEAYINGAKVHLNDGESGITPVAVEPITVVQHPDTLFDDAVGWAAAPGKLESITSRAPAHYPWLMAGQGVDINVDPSAESQLPKEPASDLSQKITDAAAAGVSAPGVSDATITSVPDTDSVSGALNKQETTAVVGGIAALAAAGPAAAATIATNTAGATQYTDPLGGAITAAVGAYAQTPSQLAAGGILKPGADKMINTLIAAGRGVDPTDKLNPNALVDSAVQTMMPPSVFTGKGGVNSFKNLVSSTTAQTKSVVTNLQKAQTVLTKSKVLTGKEGSGGISGVLTGAASLSAGGAAGGRFMGDFVNGASTPTNLATLAKTGIRQGTQAAIKAQFGGPSGGIASSLAAITGAGLFESTTPNTTEFFGNSLDTRIGPVASAFKTITKTFKPMQANTPQNLSQLAGAGRAAVSGLSPSNLTRNSVVLMDAANQVQRGLTPGLASSVATGLANMPGGSSIAGLTVNSAGAKLTENLNPMVQGLSSQVAGAANSSLIDKFTQKLAVPAFSGTDVGAVAPSSLGGMLTNIGTQGGLTSSFVSSVGSQAPVGEFAATVKGALRSLTSASGDSAKLPSIGINTFNRAGLTSLINNTIGPNLVPRPNLLGFIDTGDIQKAIGLERSNQALLTARNTVLTAQQALATAQSAYSVALADGSDAAAVIAAKAAYDTAYTAYTTAVTAYEAAEEAAPTAPSTGTPVTDPAIAKIKQAQDQVKNAAINDTNQVYGNNTSSAADTIDQQEAVANNVALYNYWFDSQFNAFDPRNYDSVHSSYANSTSQYSSGFETQNIVTPNDFSGKGIVTNLDEITGLSLSSGRIWTYTLSPGGKWSSTGFIGDSSVPGSSLTVEDGWSYSAQEYRDRTWTAADNLTASGYWVFNGTQFVWMQGPVSSSNPYLDEFSWSPPADEDGANVEENTVDAVVGEDENQTNDEDATPPPEDESDDGGGGGDLDQNDPRDNFDSA